MWTEIQIETAAAAVELVAEAAAQVAGGVELRDSETLLSAAPGRSVVVALCEPDQAEGLLAAVHEACTAARAAGISVDPLAVRRRDAHEREWRDVWKQFFRATRMGRSFLVRPSWDPGAPGHGDRIIDIDPGLAFGTGGHPSTRLVVLLAERFAERGMSVRRFLDLGCGSGILAIAAAKLWPDASGLALDTDPVAIECARENLGRNGISSVTVGIGSAPDAGGAFEFDLILANIQADVLCSLAHDLGARLAQAGALVLSGLLTDDVPVVLDVFAGTSSTLGFQVADRAEEAEWAALMLVRKS